MTVTISDIERARDALAGQVVSTPMLAAPALSKLTGVDLTVKFENLQVTNSFKDRGAFIKLASLSADDKARGVIAMSAGNHAQAVAYHASRLGIPATIVMPETTPFNKIERTRAHGAEIVLSGETLADSQVTVEAIIADRGLTLVHPYDDDHIIAGQGTIALEMLADAPDLDTLIVPIGGGGLISGNAVAAKALKPDIRIVGVETALYPSMYHALRGEPAQCGGSTLAEGIAVKNVTARTIALCRENVDEIRLVGESDIERAVNAFLCQQKVVAEGAGAAGLAAVLADPESFRGRKVGLILCGGNIDPRILASIIYRELEREHRIVSLRIEIDDRPGTLGRISTLLGQAGANILEVWHRRMFLEVPAKRADLEIMIETRDAAHADEIIALIEQQGFVTEVLDAPAGRAAQRRNAAA
ncbi:threonine ammonia-lyase [Kaustia mangrovi]|uniref:L-serine dehydratase n=1 Tax=Kaustia mangrovi TaxID=2593653 RepID=A0A7S8C7G1_9HYPH|nr:threonine ammonia-lyase [Kaustia mangrovi]QPC44823.1 threonine ammonia-lyase [Kaustia mangrovi]